MTTTYTVNDSRAWRTLAWTSVAVFMALLDATILFVAFPSVRRSFPGVGLALPSLSAASVQGLPPQRLAVGSAVNQAIRQMGSVLGVGVTVALVGGAGGHDATDAFSHLFLLVAAGGFITALIAVRIDTRHPRTTIAERTGTQSTEPLETAANFGTS